MHDFRWKWFFTPGFHLLFTSYKGLLEGYGLSFAFFAKTDFTYTLSSASEILPAENPGPFSLGYSDLSDEWF
jgi:hypothetical protein